MNYHHKNNSDFLYVCDKDYSQTQNASQSVLEQIDSHLAGCEKVIEMLLYKDKIEAEEYTEILQYFKLVPIYLDKKVRDYLYVKHIAGLKSTETDYVIKQIKNIASELVRRLGGCIFVHA